MIREFAEHKMKFLVLLLGIILLYLIISFFVYEKDPVIAFCRFLLSSYLSLADQTASFLLHLFGSPATLVSSSGENAGLLQYIGILKYKKIPIVAFILIWLTRTGKRHKIIFTLAILLTHFVVVSAFRAVEAHALISDESTAYVLTRSHHLISIILLFSLLFIWYIRKKEDVVKTLSGLKFLRNFTEKTIPLFIACYLFIVIDNFPVELNSFLPWINAIFLSAQKILGLLGYDAVIDKFSLIGEDGIINMRKGCLGIGAMFLFAAVVYLTGSRNRTRWIYIILGVLFLNIVNVVRFVLLFIYIQNHEVKQTMDVHATYGYVIYTLIFLMWILWFEKFSDLNRKAVPDNS